ncbi:MAG: hypothetical protein Q9207_001632 [Kuettlingeria erythrocarpa]
MTPSNPQFHVSKLYASEIALFDDAQLDQYLEANGRLEGLAVESLILLIFVRGQMALAGPTQPAQSHPIDLKYLSACLEDVSAGREGSPQPSSCTTTEPYDEEEYQRRELENEVECYSTLIKEGGRPSHPVNLGPGVAQDPGEYREILSIWLRETPGDHEGWKVFEAQMHEWRAFREYQRHHREGGRFPRYVGLVKRSLAKHEFTRPFEPIEDLEHQDKLTTWIEFLDYEYWLYDKDMAFVKRRQPQYDQAWKELVDSHVLRPFETEVFICSIDSAYYHQAESQQAEKAVESARSNVTSAQKSMTDLRPSSHLEREQQQRVREAESTLEAKVESLALMERRSSLISKFLNKLQQHELNNPPPPRSYLTVKEDAENRSLLCKWIRQQIPVIEAESKPVNRAGKGSTEPHVRLQTSSKRAHADESEGERSAKRRKQGSEGIKADFGTSNPPVNPSRSHHKGDDENKMFSLGRPNQTTLTSEPNVASQPPSATVEKAKVCSAQYSTSMKNTRKEATGPGKVLPKERRIKKVKRKIGRPSNSSTSGPPLRRSTRMRRPPDRFQ